jgi:hypothetical protein
MAFMAQYPAKQSGVKAASVPPVNMAYACPSMIMPMASPMAWLPLAQAEVTP